MNINPERPDPIRQFFSETLPNAGRTAKSRMKQALQAIGKTSEQLISNHQIRAAISSNENWKIDKTALKYSTPIKLLASKVRELGQAKGQERAKHMLSTSQVSLLLCCWKLFNTHHGNKNECPAPLKELFDALIEAQLLHESSPGQGYTPWFPHDQIFNNFAAIDHYIKDLQQKPSTANLENVFDITQLRLAIPSYLLEIFSPIALIPRGTEEPRVIHDDDLRLLKLLTPTDPHKFNEKASLPIILNTLGDLAVNPQRREQFLSWWDASPLQTATSADVEITAPAVFLARPVGANLGYSEIHYLVNYLRNPEDEVFKGRCAEFIRQKLSSTLDMPAVRAMDLSQQGRTWLEGLPISLITTQTIVMDALQHEMYTSLKSLRTKDDTSEDLAKMLKWISNPESFEKLKAVLKITHNDFVVFPGAEKAQHYQAIIFSADSDETLSALAALSNLVLPLEQPQNLATIAELSALSNFLKDTYGSAAIKKVGSKLDEAITYIDKVLTPLNPGLLLKLDLRLCNTMLEQWHTRDSWSAEEIKSRYDALTALNTWLSSAGDIEFPKEIIDRFPKVLEVQSKRTWFQALIDECKQQYVRMPKYDSLNPTQPFQTISHKVTALSNTLVTSSVSKHTNKNDRLTLHEFNFLKETVESNIVPYWLTKETFTLWKNFAKQYLTFPENTVVAVHFVNAAAKAKLDQTQSTRIERVKLAASLLLAKFIGTHVNISVKDSSRTITAIGINLRTYDVKLSGFINPKMDSYELNLDMLARNLSQEKQAEFKEKFPEILQEVTKQNLSYPEKDSVKARLKTFFQIQPRILPATAGFTDQTTSFCSEFVMRSIIEATVLTYKALDELPPESSRFFGLGARENLLLLSPAGLERRLKRSGIITRLNNPEQLIRF